MNYLHPIQLQISAIELSEFNKRWLKKADEYKVEDLAQCFDKFFTLYVVYNRLYGLITLILFSKDELDLLRDEKRINKDEYKKSSLYLNGERAATTCVTHFLRNELSTILKENNEAIQELLKVLPDFNIVFTPKGHEKREDEKLIKGIMADDEFRKVESILAILYNIRCNMFHARKGFNSVQMKLLVPSIMILEKIIKVLITKVDKIDFVENALTINTSGGLS